jgi:Uma2 family endonuclease
VPSGRQVPLLRRGVEPLQGFFPGAPDLAVEVVSPSDRLSEVTAKVDEWLAVGATAVWVVDPPNRTITVYRADNQVLRYGASDELRDEPALPGFHLKVNQFFGC